MKKKNIIWIMTDQQPADYLSAAGNPYLNTPWMDSIASKGIRFNRAYCPTPLCVPSRSAIFAGTTSHQAMAPTNRFPEFESYTGPMLPKLLEENGYLCGMIGKWHLQNPPDHYPGHGFSWIGLCSHNGMDNRIPTEVDRFLSIIHEKPFFLHIALTNPHDICEWARGDTLSCGSIGEVPPPEECPPLPENFSVPTGEPEILQEVQKRYPKIYPSTTWDEGKWRQYQWALLRLTEKADSVVGEILQAISNSKWAEDTIIIFTSDHGDGSARHNWNQKQSLYEECIRVPLILWDPSEPGGKVDCENLWQLGTDLFATACDYANIKCTRAVKGASLRSALNGDAVSSARDHIVVSTEFCGWGDTTGILGRSVVESQYKYIAYSAGKKKEQLFDLQADPGEMYDLLLHEKNSQRLRRTHARMQRHLNQWVVSTRDTAWAQLQAKNQKIIQ